MQCKHNAIMPNILVRDLPDDVHAAVQRNARARHQSLQQYLTAELRRVVERQRLDDVLDRIETRRGGSVGLTRAVDDLAAERTRE